MLSEPAPHLPRTLLWTACALAAGASAAAGAVGYQFIRGAFRLSGPDWLRHSEWSNDAPALIVGAGFALALLWSRSRSADLAYAGRAARLTSLSFLAVALLWPRITQTATASVLVVPVALALSTLIAVTLIRSTLSVALPFLRRGGLPWALDPIRVLSGFVTVALLVVAASSYGGVYGSMVVAMSYGCLALLAARLEQATARWSFKNSPTVRGTAVTACAFLVWTAHASGSNSSLQELYPGRLFLAYGDSNTQHIALYDTPAGPELFIDGKLEATALDHDRLARSQAALVPVAAKHVLVLGTGSGVVQKAIAAFVPFDSLTTIAPSNNVAHFAQHVPWLRERSLQGDRRQQLIVDEPYAWLEQSTEQFDAIICNLPPPLSHRDGKHYTRHFISTLTNRLTPSGRAIIHGLSPGQTPLAHQALVSTAGQTFVAAHVISVPSVGDWTLLELRRAEQHLPFRDGTSTLADPQAGYLFMSHM